MEALGRDFDVCALGTEPALAGSFARKGLRYRTYRMSRGASPLGDLYSLWRLVRIFREERPAVVHTFDSKPGIWGRLAAKLSGVPVVVGTLPGLGSLYAAPSWKGRLVRLVYQPLQTLACHAADLTTFQNEDDAREFERRRVVPAARAAVIPGSGVQTAVFAPAAPEAAAELRTGIGLDGDIVALMITRLVRSKGVLEFAAAAKAARSANPAVTFLLVGPEDADSLDAMTPEELDDVRDSVTWLGQRDDVRDVLAAADIFVFPSFYREGVPRVLLEAASMGLPLVAADVPGSRDVVEDGVNGFLVPPRDATAIAEAVLRLAAAPELRQRFGANSRERALARFDLTHVAARIEAVYRDLLTAKRVL
jgi:glycosyltransferase involved in cell wall biosynthesis